MRIVKRIYTRLIKAFAEEAEFPSDSVGAIPDIEIRGGYECTVSGCRRILDFSDERVGFDAGSVIVSVCGKGLTLADFASGCMVVRGNVSSVEIKEV